MLHVTNDDNLSRGSCGRAGGRGVVWETRSVDLVIDWMSGELRDGGGSRVMDTRGGDTGRLADSI